jgi:hypothetical protein
MNYMTGFLRVARCCMDKGLRRPAVKTAPVPGNNARMKCDINAARLH